jgi:tetratricopeptide (TPR) repeat protein
MSQAFQTVLEGMGAFLLGLVAWAAAPQENPQGPELVERLDAVAKGKADESGPPEAEAAFEQLSKLGPEGVRASFESWESASRAGRRWRARLLAKAGDGGCVDLAARALAEADVETVHHALAYLGRSDLGSQELEKRIDLLAGAARGARDSETAIHAVRSLAGLGADQAAAALDSLLTDLGPSERAIAVERMGEDRATGELVISRVLSGFAPSGQDALEDVDLALLLDRGYGRALAERESVAAEHLVPFVLGPRHPHPSVRAASRSARAQLIDRLRFLGDVDRADALLVELAELSSHPQELFEQRAQLALVFGSEPQVASSASASLARVSRGSTDYEGGVWRFKAAYFGAAADLARGEFEAAWERSGDALAEVDSLLLAQVDRRAEQRALVQANVHQWGGLAHLLRASVVLARSGESVGESDRQALLEEVRAAHEASIAEQEVRASSPRTLFSPLSMPSTLDLLLDHPLSPTSLVLQNPRLRAWPRTSALALKERLYRALACVAQREMVGFEPLLDGLPERLSDPLKDPERVDRLQRIASAHERRLFEELAALDPDDPRTVLYQRAYLELRRVRAQGAQAELLLQRLPCEAALDLARDFSGEGRTFEARALAERMLRDVGEGGDDLRGADEILLARVEMLIGSTFTDEGEPERAQTALLKAHERLELLAESARERGANEGFVQQIERLRANVLVSLAVNANVKLGQPEKALEYFEEACALRENDDFMRVLLACYRARAGRAEEARELLRDVPPSPGTYYNMACTYALLGDRENALAFLERELRENHFSSGSLMQQQEWARSDPDLESLRGDSRFEALLELELSPAER